MLPTFFWTLLFATMFYALLKGTNELRIAAAGCVAATVATRLLKAPGAEKYSDMEFGVMAVDVSLFGLFLFIALRSQRFWPLWVAGFHLVTVSAHAIKAMKIDLIPTAYALAVQFWSYPVLLCIGVAVWRAQRRRIAEALSNAPPTASA